MNIILRRNDGEGGMVPAYRPLGSLDIWDSLSRELWDSWSPFTFGDGMVPYSDIYEEKDGLVMKAELPGVDKKDLEITLEGDRLTIKAEKKEESKEDATHHARERYYGSYLRSITLPYAVKEDRITAELENGVLEVRLPKGEEVKPRKIEVKAQLPESKTGKKEKKSRQKKS